MGREIIPTRAMVMNPVRFELDSIHNYLCKRLVRTMERGFAGGIDKEQAPGYTVAVKIALALLDRTAPVTHALPSEAYKGAVTINLVAPGYEPARPDIRSGSLSLHLPGGNGHGNGSEPGDAGEEG